MPKIKLHWSETSFLIKVFGMQEFSVLDFSHERFDALFKEYGVDIHQPQYQYHGTRDAQLLVGFVETEDGALAGKVLRRLWDYRAQRAASSGAAHDSENELKEQFFRLVHAVEEGRGD